MLRERSYVVVAAIEDQVDGFGRRAGLESVQTVLSNVKDVDLDVVVLAENFELWYATPLSRLTDPLCIFLGLLLST